MVFVVEMLVPKGCGQHPQGVWLGDTTAFAAASAAAPAAALAAASDSAAPPTAAAPGWQAPAQARAVTRRWRT